MDGKGWKPEYGISPEGVRLLGFVEALPQDEREKVADEVERFCRAQGYISLHDNLRAFLERDEEPTAEPEPRLAKVLPFRRSGG